MAYEYEIERLWKQHQEIARRTALGDKGVDIANDLGLTPQTVYNFRNSELGTKRITDLQKQIDQEAVNIGRRLQEISPRAMDILECVVVNSPEAQALLNGAPDLKTRIAVAQDILSRAGYPTQRLVKGEIAHGFFTKDDIEDIKRRAFNSGSGPEIVNAEEVGVE